MTLRISDHALVRFLTRAAGAEVEALRARLSASLTRAANAAGRLDAGEYKIVADGLEYVVKDGVVTTVLDPKERRR